MEEPDKRDYNHASNLEDTVRNLREENAKLLQLLRTQGLLLDPSLNTNGKSSESISSTVPDSTNITFDHSDLTLTTNSTTITNQINHQHIHNHGPMNQQNYNEQTIQGNQSNITPNFNTVIQTNTQPFVQNNSNTLVQNNTNLIQPINLVNFNNVSLDSIQSFFASQNNVMYLSQTSTSEKTMTTSTTTTSTTSISPNCLPNDSSSSSEKPPISIRIKPLINRQHQELVPVIPKMKAEHYENLTRKYASSSNSNTTNLLNNDSNHKFPRSIRPKLSSRTNSLRIYKPVVLNETQSSSNILRASSPYVDSSPTISLFSSPNYSSSPSTTTTTNYQSQTSSIENQYDLPISLVHSKSSDLSISSTNKKSNKPRQRNRKKPSNTSSTLTITLNHGRPLASTLSNTQRTTTSNNPITKRSTTNRKPTKRNIKTLVHSQSESILPINSSSPSTAFAESVSGLLENLDQELMASNFLSQTTASHLLSNEITTTSMPTLDEFNDRLEHETHDFNVESEQITSFMSEEDMRLVEMNFDENTFLKQFDLEDAGIRLSVNSDQNLFASILTDNPNQMNDQSITQTNSSVSHPPSTFPSSSLINNNVFTTVVPLGSQRQQQQQILQTNTLLMTNMTSLLPEEGVQLTARHIEPSQVATYESVNYQNILDDLVMVTDQDALRHAQATAADDPTVISTDFSFALLEETNEIINSANIQLTTEQASTVLNELQYFYPIEQQAELTQKQGEIQPNQQQPIVILENLQSNIIASTTLNENLPDNSIINTSVTDLSSFLELESIDSLVPPLNVPTTTQLITPGRSNKSSSNDNQSIDFDSLLSSSHIQNTFSNDTANIYSPILDTLALPSSALQLRETSESCALIESNTSTSHSSIFIKPIQDEMIIDSGCLAQLNTDKSTLNNDDNVIEDLLRESTITTTDPYEIIETQGKTPVKKYLIIDNVDQLLDQIEPRKMSSKLFERTFSRYQQKYHSNLQHQQNLQIKQFQETTPVIPPVKLGLHQIYKQKSPSPQPLEHSSLKITLCPKLSPNVSSERKTQKKKIHKNKNKKSHHHHRHQKKKTLTNQSPEMESSGLTQFEQPLNQLYNQTAPATLIEAQPKNETHTQSPIQSESQQLPSSPAYHIPRT
ncbi:hypothetical protein I4U23_017741 [Adineta vaga]|nr:hypothetical protein I4U23_017741 [Adineta vaga]